MNNELILKSTGKEFHIVNELLKFIKYSDCVFISKSNPLIYKMGDDSIMMTTDSEYEVVLDERIKDVIAITDIYEPKNETELDISVGIVRLYRTYEFKISLGGVYSYTIKGKFKIKESKPMKDVGLDHIREVYEKIESINLIDPKVFESDKFSVCDYKFTILNYTSVVNLNNIKPIVKMFNGVIDSFYSNGISKVSPKDSDK
jgi:hypothetical protein